MFQKHLRRRWGKFVLLVPCEVQAVERPARVHEIINKAELPIHGDLVVDRVVWVLEPHQSADWAPESSHVC